MCVCLKILCGFGIGDENTKNWCDFFIYDLLDSFSFILKLSKGRV
jgi:hypothetical protein